MADSVVNILFKIRDEANEALKKIRKEAEGLNDELDELDNQKLDGAQSEAEELRDDIEELGEETEDAARDFNALRNAGLKIGAIGSAIAAPFFLAAKAAGEFSVQIAEIGTLVPDAVQNNEQLRRSVIDLSNEFGQDRAAVAAAYYNAVSTGARAGAEAVNLLAVAAQLAVGGVTDINSATRLLSSVINAYGLSARDAQQVSDALFTTVKDGATTIEQLSSALFNVGPTAAALGVQMEEVNAALATLTLSGTPTTIATTQLRAALVGIARSSPEVVEALGDYNDAGEAIRDLGLAETFRRISKAADGQVGEMIKLVGTIEGVAAIVGTTGQNFDTFEEKLENQQNAAGATADAYAEIEKTFGRQVTDSVVALSNAFEALGNLVIPVLQPLAAGVENVAEAFTDFANENQTFLSFVVGGITILASLTAAIGLLVAAIAGLRKGLQVAKGVLGGYLLVTKLAIANTLSFAGASRALGLAWRFALGPVGLAIGAITALATATRFFERDMTTAADAIDRTVDSINQLSEAELAFEFPDVVDDVQILSNAVRAQEARLQELKDKLPAPLEFIDTVVPDEIPFIPNSVIRAEEEKLKRLEDALTEAVAVRDRAAERLSDPDSTLRIATDDAGFAKFKQKVEEAADNVDFLRAVLEQETLRLEAPDAATFKRSGRGQQVVDEPARNQGELTEEEDKYLKQLDEEITKQQDILDFQRQRLDTATEQREDFAAAAKKRADEKAYRDAQAARIAAARLEQRLIQNQQREELQLVRNQSDAIIQNNQLEQQRLEQQYKNKEVSAEEYYNELRRITQENSMAELQILETQLQQVEAARQAAINTAKAGGAEDDGVELQAIDAQFNAQAARVEGQMDRLATNLTLKLEGIGIDAADAGLQGIKTTVDQINTTLTENIQNIQADLDAGFITKADAQQEIVAATRDANVQLREQLALLRELAVLDPDNEALLQYIEDVENAIARTATKTDAFALEIKAIGQGELANFFEDILEDVDNVGEAFDKLIQNMAKQIRRLVAEKLAKKLMDSLFGSKSVIGGFFNSEGGQVATGGYVAAGGGYMAPSLNAVSVPPQYVAARGGYITPPKRRLRGPSRGLRATGKLLATGGSVGPRYGKAPDGAVVKRVSTRELSTQALSSRQTRLNEARTTINNVSSKSAKDEYLEELRKFSVARTGGMMLAAGGPGIVKGKGTATSDHVGPLWLSRGEYVIKAASVAKYGTNMMEAINRGLMPKIDVGQFTVSRPRKHRFAEGGAVGPPNVQQLSKSISTEVSQVQSTQEQQPTMMSLEVSEGALNMTMRDFLEREFGNIIATR